MASSLVSVVVPTFNRAYCLARTLDSALAQTHRDLEVIVVDDGSTDDTGAMLRSRYDGEPRLRYLHQPNRGVCAARNHGLAAARGDFVALLDSDDVWLPWKLAVQIECMRSFPDVGMVWTDMDAVDPDGKVFARRYLRTMYDAYRWFSDEELFDRSIPLREIVPELAADVTHARLQVGDIFSQMVMGNLVHTSTVLLRRDRIERVGRFDESLSRAGEDYDFHLRTCREGPVGFIDASSILYQRGMPDRLTRPDLAVTMAKNFLRTLETILARDRHRIRLPQRMIDSALADAHGWMGEAMLNQGDRRGARKHLLQSALLDVRRPRSLRPLIAASLPPSVVAVLRRVIQRARRSLVQPPGRRT